MDELVDILREHKNWGLARQEAYEALDSLRGGASDQLEDRILEVMDVVSGFCAPHYRVWAT
jgi:hypothetical protein